MVTEQLWPWCTALFSVRLQTFCGYFKLQSTGKKMKKPNYWSYCRADWWKMTPIPLTFFPSWCHWDYISFHYRSSYFYSYDNFPARFLILVWFCSLELMKWPQCPKAHHSSVHISGFSSCLHPFMVLWLSFINDWLCGTHSRMLQLPSSICHLRTRYIKQATLQILQFNTCTCHFLVLWLWITYIENKSLHIWVSSLFQKCLICVITVDTALPLRDRKQEILNKWEGQK